MLKLKGGTPDCRKGRISKSVWMEIGRIRIPEKIELPRLFWWKSGTLALRKNEFPNLMEWDWGMSGIHQEIVQDRARGKEIFCPEIGLAPFQCKGVGQQKSHSNATLESTGQVAHQTPHVHKETSLHHGSHLHAGSLGTTRSSDPSEVICAPTAEH